MALTDEDKQWIAERLGSVETKLLTAFHAPFASVPDSWASPVEARQRGQRELLDVLDLQVSDLEERMRKLESGREPKQ